MAWLHNSTQTQLIIIKPYSQQKEEKRENYKTTANFSHGL